MIKLNKLTYFTALVISFLLVFFGCSSKYNGDIYDNSYLTGNEYNQITENPVTLVSETPASAFSMNVNTAAYANLRRYINSGYTIDKNQVRIEEMVNYFKYNYPQPQDGDPFSVTSVISPCPWNSSARLLSIGLKAEDVEFTSLKNNLVFLLDVSGSMNSDDKLGLMQSAFKLLTEKLNENDTVSIVTYAGSESVILEGAKGAEKILIQNKIEDLSAGGSTGGARGIITAYELARKYFIEGGNNRVILATDGDFNVGVSSQEGLKNLITEKRQSGIFLTVLGFGYGNLKDNKLDTLAKCGNGNYGYIDNINEARKILIEEIGGTLKTIAKDVKAQVVFNPAKVYSYRLLGYENSLLTNEDWENDQKDAGEIGAGHTVTAVYEIVLNSGGNYEDTMENNYLKVSVRYKAPEGADDVKELNKFAGAAEITETPGEDSMFISAVVEAALIMRNSEYKGNAAINNVISRLQGLDCVKEDSYKAEFLDLMIKYSK